MQKFILISFVLALSACSTLNTESVDVIKRDRLDVILCRETAQGGIVKIDNKDFRLDEDGVGYGQFSFEGSLVKNRELVPFSGANVDSVYLVVSDDNSTAFAYFQRYAENNDSINKMVNGLLYFKLGVLQNGALELSAELTEGTEQKILSALGAGAPLRFTMLQAITLGSGANEYSVMPCVIDANW